MAESVEVPFRLSSEGRRYLTAEQVEDNPELLQFVLRFGACFAYDHSRNIFWFYPENAETPGPDFPECPGSTH